MKRIFFITSLIFFLITIGLSPEGQGRVDAANGRGTIAYVRGGAEIHLIDPDGGNDRRVWSLPRPELAATMGINGVAWRPDGKELAFTSGHEAVQSLYQSDVYTIKPDGSDLRKVTNPPSADEFARFSKGSVSVTVRSGVGIMAAPSTSFLVYVEGAPEPQTVALPPGSSRTLVFQNVADLGAHPQPVVAMFGKSRWFIPGVDVQAGRTVQAGTLNIAGKGLELYGAYGVAWRSDGTELTYGMGNCAGLFTVPAEPTAGAHQDKPVLTGNASGNACTWDWGPTRETADKILIGGGMLDANVYLATAGSSSRGEKQVGGGATDLLTEVQWLPDGSGFLLSVSTGSSANLYRYDFATKQAKQLTHFDGEFVRSFAVSPDGQSVVFERAASFSGGSGDLWIMQLNGRGQKLLIKNASSPSWGPQ